MNIINKKFGKRGIDYGQGRLERYSRSDDRKWQEAPYWRPRCKECGRKVCECEETKESIDEN